MITGKKKLVASRQVTLSISLLMRQMPFLVFLDQAQMLSSVQCQKQYMLDTKEPLHYQEKKEKGINICNVPHI